MLVPSRMRAAALALAVAAAATAPASALAQGRDVSSALSDEFARVAATAAPSVVTVLVETEGSAVPGFFGDAYGGVRRGSGSGVVLDERGLVLTNHHVVEDATRIELELADGRRVPGRLLGDDPAIDLALVKAELDNTRPARFGDSDKVRAGQWVVAVGAPFGLRHTLTAGVISAVGRSFVENGVAEEYLQTDASINPGNSGGPLLNLRGEVVGINTVYLGNATGIGFAIPSNLAREIASQLAQHGRVERGYIGMRTQELSHELARYFGLRDTRGVLVTAVLPGSPAAGAHLAAGDIIVRFNGKPVCDPPTLLRHIAATQAGAAIELHGYRRGKLYTFSMHAAHPPAGAHAATGPGRATRARHADALLGLKVRALSAELRREVGYSGPAQVLITGVAPASPADRAGLQPGLLLLDADLAPVQRPRDLFERLRDGRVLLRVEDESGHVAFVLLQKDR